MALSGRNATYFPEPGFVGTASLTFAAWDGSIDSNLGRVTVTVKAPISGQSFATTEPVEINISLEADQVVLSWPGDNAGLTVETTDDLGTGEWQPVNVPATTEGGFSHLTVPTTKAGQFFRLRTL